MSTTHREGRWRGRRPRARHGGAKRRSAEGGGVWKGRRSPYSVWGSGGIAPRKFWNLIVQICSFFSTISRHFATSHNTLQQSTAHLTKSTAHFVSENTQFWPCLALHQNSNYSATLQRYLTIQKATPVVRIDLNKKNSLVYLVPQINLILFYLSIPEGWKAESA